MARDELAQIMSLAQREQRAPELLEQFLRIGVQPQEQRGGEPQMFERWLNGD